MRRRSPHRGQRVESTAGVAVVGQGPSVSRPFGCECLNLLTVAPSPAAARRKSLRAPSANLPWRLVCASGLSLVCPFQELWATVSHAVREGEKIEEYAAITTCQQAVHLCKRCAASGIMRLHDLAGTWSWGTWHPRAPTVGFMRLHFSAGTYPREPCAPLRTLYFGPFLRHPLMTNQTMTTSMADLPKHVAKLKKEKGFLTKRPSEN